MFGEQYYRNRLVGLYEFSPIAYTPGIGELHNSHLHLSVQWELVVSVTGEIILVLFSNEPVEPYMATEHDLSLTGVSENRIWNIEIPLLAINSVSMSSEDPTSSIICTVREIWLRRQTEDKIIIDRIEGLVSNFDFVGSEYTQEGTRRSLDLIRVNAYDKEILLRTNHDAQLIKEQIKSKRIDRAILSSITIPLALGETDEEITTQLSTICWFLSLVNVNSCMCPVVYYKSDEGVSKIHIINILSSPYHVNVLVDNLLVRHGIEVFFTSSFAAYCRIDTTINMRLLISNLLGMYEGKFIENKIAGLLLSFEYILTQYLISQGRNRNAVLDSSIQDKLRQINIYLRFIDARLLGDDLRGNVRNPLFHTGALTDMNVTEKYNLFNEYFDLLIQIILRVLDYTGGYLSPIDHLARNIP